MPRSGVKAWMVEEAVKRLMNEGKHPTIERVRIILGTGSYTTISRHLRNFQKKPPTTNDKPPGYWQGFRDACMRQKQLVESFIELADENV